MADRPPRPTIDPLPAGAPRPRWSVMIPTYNCARELRTALESVLRQAPGCDEMQIEVVDDCSTRDDPEAVVREVGGGRVSFHRQDHNVGHTRNFNACLQRARGRLVHLLHGDDFVLHGFHRTMERAFEAAPEIGAAFCRFIVVDEEDRWRSVAPLLQDHSGVIADWLPTIAEGQRLQPPTIVVRREVYERVGGFDERIAAYGEDWEMWVRIAAHFPVWHQVDALAAYRIHGTSLSGRAMRTGQNVRDLRMAIELNREVLPADRAAEITRAAREANALGVIRRAHRALAQGDVETPLAQLREVLRLSTSPRVVAGTTRLLARWAWHRARRRA